MTTVSHEPARDTAGSRPPAEREPWFPVYGDGGPPGAARDPESLRATLATVAETAAALTALLDGLRREQTREPAIRQTPVCVELDQAAAAAVDLRAAAESAARAVAGFERRAPQVRLPRQETPR
ncbi:hypothetical protein [Amycolatopsis ruanii]|uniref:hypothetical protein n=1 Tax=Amycolatopsis ruanii TaxID=944491 RepID=UPI000E238B48|nr:hypothetical protein [Amycolatopsis ruanii]